MAHGHDHSHHIIPISKLVQTALILGVLMVLTIAWANYYGLVIGGLPGQAQSIINNLVAMGIASVKAWLVIQIFMGVKFQSNLVKTFAILGFVWMTLMFSMFADYGTRRWEPVKGWTPGDAEVALPRVNEPFEQGMPARDTLNIPENKH